VVETLCGQALVGVDHGVVLGADRVVGHAPVGRARLLPFDAPGKRTNGGWVPSVVARTTGVRRRCRPARTRIVPDVHEAAAGKPWACGCCVALVVVLLRDARGSLPGGGTGISRCLLVSTPPAQGPYGHQDLQRLHERLGSPPYRRRPS
jgi:hypothetical protein